MNTGLLRPTVATAPTVYGIETHVKLVSYMDQFVLVATAPTVYGIETVKIATIPFFIISSVATAPTVYGIETQYKA